MPTTAGDGVVIASFEWDVSQILSSQAKMAASVNQLKNHAFATTSSLSAMDKGLKGVKDAVQITEKGMFGLNGQMNLIQSLISGPAGIAVGLGALSFGLIEIGREMAKVADEADKFEKRLKVLSGGSAEVAKNIHETVNALAKNSPFSLEQLEQAAVSVRKFGGSVSELLPIAQNMAAAIGGDVGSAADVLGKIVQGDTRALRMLHREFGVSNAELGKLGLSFQRMGAGAKLTQEQIEGLKKLLETKFMGGAAEQANTFSGSVMALKNEWKILSENIGSAVLPIMKDVVLLFKEGVDWVDQNKAAIHDWISSIVSAIEGTAKAFKSLWDSNWSYVTPIVGTFKAILFVVESVINAIGELGRVMGHLSTLDFKGALQSIVDFEQGKTGAFESGAAKEEKPKADVGGENLLGEDTQGAQKKADKLAQINETLDKKLQEIYAQDIQKRIDVEEDYLKHSEGNAAKQKEHEKEIMALLEQKHEFEMKALDDEFAKQVAEGADAGKIAQIKLAAEQKFHDEKIKMLDHIHEIEKKQIEEIEKKELAKEEKSALKKLEGMKKAAEIKEKQTISGLEKQLKEEEKQQKDIDEAIKMQIADTKALEEEKKKAQAEYAKGPLMSLKDVAAELRGETKFGSRSFAPSTASAPTFEEELAKVQAAKPSTPLTDIEGKIAGTKSQIEAEKAKEQNIQNINVSIDNTAIKSSPELAQIVNQIVTQLIKASGQAANFQPTAAGHT